jgi:hypothetical protein
MEWHSWLEGLGKPFDSLDALGVDRCVIRVELFVFRARFE